MAESFVRDANLERYRDLDLNFTAHPITGDITTLTAESAIKRALKNLVLTRYYDIPFKPAIGSDANNLLFENSGPLVEIELQEAITNVITEYEPRVELDNVSVNVDPDEYTANVTITFYILSQPAPITTTLIIKRNK